MPRQRWVLDTNVVIAALGGRASASRRAVFACLRGEATLLMSAALSYEYLDVALRPGIAKRAGGSRRRVENLIGALYDVAEWRSVHFRFRPNLRDEADNHVVELALAGNATAIVTYNVRDFLGGELSTGSLAIVTPATAMELIDDG